MANPHGERSRRLAAAGLSGLAYFITLTEFYTASGSWMGGNEHPVASQHQNPPWQHSEVALRHGNQSAILWAGQQ